MPSHDPDVDELIGGFKDASLPALSEADILDRVVDFNSFAPETDAARDFDGYLTGYNEVTEDQSAANNPEFSGEAGVMDA